MRVFKPGTTPKAQPPREPRRRSRIEYHLTCPNCSCEFGITEDEMLRVNDPTDPAMRGREPIGHCPHCYKPVSYNSAVRVNTKGKPVR